MKLCKLLLLSLATSAVGGDLTFPVTSNLAVECIIKDAERGPLYALAANEDQLAAGGVDGLSVWNIGPPECQHIKTASTVYSLDFGKQTLYAGCGIPGESGILLAIEGDEQTERARFHEPVCDVSVSPDGSQLVAVSGDGQAVVWSTDDWAEEYRIEETNTFFRAVDFSSDGQMLAIGDAQGCVRIFNTEDWSQAPQQRNVQGSISALHFSKSRATTFYVSCDMGASKGVTVFRTDNKKMHRHGLQKYAVQGIYSSKRGANTLVAVDAGGLKLVKGDKVDKSYPAGTEWSQAALFICNERLSVSAGVDGKIYIFDSWNGVIRGLLLPPRADGSGWAMLSSRGSIYAAKDIVISWNNPAGETLTKTEIAALNKRWKVRQILDVPAKKKRKAVKK